MKKIMPDDHFIRFVYSREASARDLALTSLPDCIIRILDLEAIEISPESYVEQRLAGCQSDLLIRTRIGATPFLIYILLEHKSSPEQWTLLQMLKYMVRIWEKEMEQKPVQDKLPPIVPLIFYPRTGRWKLLPQKLFPQRLLPLRS